MADLRVRTWLSRLYKVCLVVPIVLPGVLKICYKGVSPDVVMFLTTFFLAVGGFCVLALYHLTSQELDARSLLSHAHKSLGIELGLYWFISVCIITVLYIDDPVGYACLGIALGVLALSLFNILFSEYIRRQHYAKTNKKHEEVK